MTRIAFEVTSGNGAVELRSIAADEERSSELIERLRRIADEARKSTGR